MLGDEDGGTFLQDIENVQSNQLEIQRLRSLYDEAAQDYSKKSAPTSNSSTGVESETAARAWRNLDIENCADPPLSRP